MKRRKLISAAAIAAATASLCGCTGKLPFSGNTLDFDKSYTVCADISCGELSAKADVTRISASDYQFAFTEPKELCGIILEYGENGYTAKLGGLSFKADENAGYAMLPEIIASSLNSVVGLPSENIEQSDGVATLETQFDGKKVTVEADSKTGGLISLKCPYHQLSVEFSDQKPYVSDLPDEGGLIVRN